MPFYPAGMPTNTQWWTCSGTRTATGCWPPLVITCLRCLTSATWSLNCRPSRDTRKRQHVRQLQNQQLKSPSVYFSPPPSPPPPQVHILPFLCACTSVRWIVVKSAWFGHVTQHDSLSKIILQGTFEGGWCSQQRNWWMDNIKEWTSLPMPELLTRASCRKDGKRISAELSIMSTPLHPAMMIQSVKGLNWTEFYYNRIFQILLLFLRIC